MSMSGWGFSVEKKKLTEISKIIYNDYSSISYLLRLQKENCELLDGCWFPNGYKWVGNPLESDKFSDSLWPKKWWGDDKSSYPNDKTRLEIPAGKNGREYLNVSPVLIDNITFIVEQLNIDAQECTQDCAKLWSTVFHGDIPYVIVIDNKCNKSKNKWSPELICHLSQQSQFAREILTEDGSVAKEIFELEELRDSFSRLKCSSTFAIKQRRKIKTVTCFRIYTSGTKSHLEDLLDAAKQFIPIMEEIKKISEVYEFPRVMLRSRVYPFDSEILIVVYRFWSYAKKKIHFHTHMADELYFIRQQRWNFVPGEENYKLLFLLLPKLFLEGMRVGIHRKANIDLVLDDTVVDYYFVG